MKTKAIREAIRRPYAWPGGYPLALMMNDGECLCMKCARKEWKLICRSTRNEDRDGWQAVVPFIVWENDGSDLCAHCGEVLESAYGDPND